MLTGEFDVKNSYELTRISKNQMKAKFTRRKFLQTAAITTTAARIPGDDLLRYVLTMPVSVANVGMDGFAPLESCVEVGKEPLLSAAEDEKIRIRLNFDPGLTKLPYFVG
jgi:hypothetical protein